MTRKLCGTFKWRRLITLGHGGILAQSTFLASEKDSTADRCIIDFYCRCECRFCRSRTLGRLVSVDAAAGRGAIRSHISHSPIPATCAVATDRLRTRCKLVVAQPSQEGSANSRIRAPLARISTPQWPQSARLARQMVESRPARHFLRKRSSRTTSPPPAPPGFGSPGALGSSGAVSCWPPGLLATSAGRATAGS